MDQSGASRTRILVVEDHPVVRLGIRRMLREHTNFTICGEADSAEAALSLAKASDPNLALVDLSLADGTGLELIRAFRESTPDLPVLVLSMHEEALFAERVLRAGARGYIMKQEAIARLVDAIQYVLSGHIYLSEAMSQQMLERLGDQTHSTHSASGGDPLGCLTDREIEVFELIGRGRTTAAIATQLGVSVKTVETHRSNIKTKLHLGEAADVVRLAAAWAERR